MTLTTVMNNGVTGRNDLTNRPRKLSLQVVFPRPSLSGYAAAIENAREAQLASVRRRKLSQVTHKLSTTIGWRVAVSQDDVINQAQSLCGRYLRSKLRSFGSVQKKLGLQRLRSLSKISSDPILIEVGEQLLHMTGILERQNPCLFHSVMDGVGIQSLASETAMINLFRAVADEILRQDISWGRIIALYCVAGGLAMDCVRLGHPEYVLNLVQGMGSVVEGEVAVWIVHQGGWEALITRFRNSANIRIIHLVSGGIVFILVMVFLFYWISRRTIRDSGEKVKT
ncbi:bcl-2-related ovarian killer protein homolog B-like [Limulus polyphemus]|uniref:Bcl-2-related ovarian killer protein homolog B-like n=1 Tax=Limulus polyphemus TaxID=6850 RepID=A0ABM1B117_LIMPO|nr:bcl-2-related ovarian killer protein homolog B-like [Limulus polyphemus]